MKTDGGALPVSSPTLPENAVKFDLIRLRAPSQ
jgi:hypothetical protein